MRSELKHTCFKMAALRLETGLVFQSLYNLKVPRRTLANHSYICDNCLLTERFVRPNNTNCLSHLNCPRRDNSRTLLGGLGASAFGC